MDTEPEAPGKERRAWLASEDWKDAPGWRSGWLGEPILDSLELRKVGCPPRTSQRRALRGVCGRYVGMGRRHSLKLSSPRGPC